MQARRSNANHPRTRTCWAALLAWAVVVAGCGGAAALVVPFIGFGFSDNNVKVGADTYQVSMFLFPERPTTASGAIEAGANISVDGGAQHPVQGSYSGCTLSLDVRSDAAGNAPPTPLAMHYSGRFTGSDTLELTPDNTTLPVLRMTRNLPADPPMDC